MKLCKIESFTNNDGSQTSFISVPEKYKEQIDATLDLLAQQLSLTNDSVGKVEEAVSKATEEASVVYFAKIWSPGMTSSLSHQSI